MAGSRRAPGVRGLSDDDRLLGLGARPGQDGERLGRT
jgi:hypothetical protein